MKANKLDDPDNIEVLSQGFEDIPNTNSQNRETELIEGTDRFFNILFDELVVEEDGERTHGQVEEDEEGQFPHQTQYLIRI